MADAFPGSLAWHKKRSEMEQHPNPLPSVVAWHLVEKKLRERIDTALGLLGSATGLREIGYEQGRIAAFKELMNLRSAIMVDKEEG